MQEVWRRDGTESGEPFAMPRDLLASKDGTLWMRDFKDQRIRRFDGNGKELSGVGRLGSGPGEFRNANGLLLHPDGSVWVNDPLNARLSIFTPNGKYSRQVTVATTGWGMHWDAWIDAARGRVADPILITRGFGGARSGWRLLTAGAPRRDTIARPSCPSGAVPPAMRYSATRTGKNAGAMMGRYPFTTGGGEAPDGRGGMWCADAGSTRVALVRIPRGDTIARTSIDLPPLSVGRAERDSVARAMTKAVAAYTTSDFDASKLRSTKPGIAYVQVDDDRRLWVQHSRLYGSSTTTFDVHDRRGSHVARVSLPAVLLHDGFMPIVARGNDVWANVVDADGVPAVARFRIVK